MSDQSAAVCPVCGVPRCHAGYCGSCEAAADGCVLLALSIRRFARRAEVRRLVDDAMVWHEWACSESSRSDHPDTPDDCVCGATRRRLAVRRLAELALEDR